MKNVFSFVIGQFLVLTFSGFTSNTSPGWVEDRYYVDDLAQVVDEATISAYDTQEGRYGAMKVCPGTGEQCVIKLAADHEDGDPVWLVSLKGKGKKNIEFLVY